MNRWLVLFLVLLSSCSSIPSVKTSDHSVIKQDEVLKDTPVLVIERTPSIIDLRGKIADFKQRLVSHRVLTEDDWRLHDELMENYIQLKNFTLDNVIEIPAHTRQRVPLHTFCMNPGLGAPVLGEQFVWKKSKSEIPYFRDVVEYGIAHPGISKHTIQTLIWNLKSGTRWENYPKEHQKILLGVDPQAPFKLPSEIKDNIGRKAQTVVTDKLKQWGLWGQVEEVSRWVRGEYQNFESIEKRLLSFKSKYSLSPSSALESIPETPLFVETVTHGYSSHDVVFYNPSDHVVRIDLTQYYMQPKRPDIQRMGLQKIIPQECSFECEGPGPGSFLHFEEAYAQEPSDIKKLACPKIVQELEDVLYSDMLRAGIGFVPLVNNVADIYELLEGRSFLSGEVLTGPERLWSGLGLIAGSGEGYRYVLRIINSPKKYLGEFEKGMSQWLRRGASFAQQGLIEANNILIQAKVGLDKLGRSPALKRFFTRPLSKADFYVKPNGEIIPSKAYRYIRSDGKDLQRTLESGIIPSGERGTYVSFDDFNSPGEAKNYLQIPKEPKYQAEIDTLNYLHDLKIPKGSYGKGNSLEPIVGTEVHYGEGGATQAVINKEIKAKRIVDMESGKVVYEEMKYAN